MGTSIFSKCRAHRKSVTIFGEVLHWNQGQHFSSVDFGFDLLVKVFLFKVGKLLLANLLEREFCCCSLCLPISDRLRTCGIILAGLAVK